MRKVKKILNGFSQYQSGLLFLVVYFLLVPLFAVILKFSRKDFQGWQRWSIKSDRLEEVMRQY